MKENQKTKKDIIDTYRRTDVMTANRETILLMLYAGAIRFLKRAIEATEQNDMNTKGKSITRVLQIVNELQATLDPKQSEQIAQSLESLYGFIQARLLDSNTDRSTKPLKEALDILETLNSAWEEAVEGLKTASNIIDKKSQGG